MYIRLIGLLVLFIAAISCSRPDQSYDKTVLASVAGKSLTVAEAMEQIPPHVLELDTLNALNSYAEQWVESQIAIRQAERLRLERSPDVQKRLQRTRDQVLKSALKDHILLQNLEETEVSEEEARNYFQEHKDRFILEERYVRYRHLTTRTRTEADNANRDLMRGVEWEDVANRYSINPEQQIRQSNNFLPISLAAQNIPALNRYLRAMGITERSPIQFHGGRYHFVQLIEERPEGEHPELIWLIPQIKEWLKLEKARRITNGYLRNLYLEADTNNEIDRADVTELESILTNFQNN